MTWDEIAASTHLLWARGDDVIVEITRETVDVVSLDKHKDGYLITISSTSEGVAGVLSVGVNPGSIRIHDSILQT